VGTDLPQVSTGISESTHLFCANRGESSNKKGQDYFATEKVAQASHFQIRVWQHEVRRFVSNFDLVYHVKTTLK
jgi:hypothetical protein